MRQQRSDAEYTRDHSNSAVDSVLAGYGYEGYLVADAHVVYDHLYGDGSAVSLADRRTRRRGDVLALKPEIPTAPPRCHPSRAAGETKSDRALRSYATKHATRRCEGRETHGTRR